MKFPKALGACADKMWELREKKRKAKRVVDEIEVEEKALKAYIINTLPKSEASGISGKVANVTVVSKEIPQVEDYSKFYKYVAKTGRFDLMQKRLSVGAINEMFDDGKKIPGLTTFNVVSISLTKAR